MLPNGQQTAKEMYGCRGFVAHHNTDLWGDTAPQDIYIPATFWVMGGAWLCTHIWRHYTYTDDRKFLEKMYPLLKESVQFFMDFLVEKEGKLVTCPSVSPENTYIMKDGTKGCLSYGVTMDNEILHELFADFKKPLKFSEKRTLPFWLLPANANKNCRRSRLENTDRSWNGRKIMKRPSRGTVISPICGHFIRHIRLHRTVNRNFARPHGSPCSAA